MQCNFHWDRFGIVEGKKMAFKEFFSLFSHFKVLLLCGLATDSPPLRERYMHIHFGKSAHIQLHNHIFSAICIYAPEHVQRAQNSSNMKRECVFGKESELSIAHCASSNCNIFSFCLIIHIVFKRLISLLSALFSFHCCSLLHMNNCASFYNY